MAHDEVVDIPVPRGDVMDDGPSVEIQLRPLAPVAASPQTPTSHFPIHPGGLSQTSTEKVMAVPSKDPSTQDASGQTSEAT